jgi:hypothetical protein
VRTTAKASLAAVAVFACVLAWGYWHAATHASMNLRVEDHGLKTDRQLYGDPHGVSLTFFGTGNEQLASARSIEPAGYILAIHPDPKIGDCTQYQNAPGDYAECYEALSAWASRWAPRVREATVEIGGCTLRNVPVTVHGSNAEWWLWWVPLPHIGGTPRRYFELVVKIDTKTCAAVSQYPGAHRVQVP